MALETMEPLDVAAESVVAVAVAKVLAVEQVMLAAAERICAERSSPVAVGFAYPSADLVDDFRTLDAAFAVAFAAAAVAAVVAAVSAANESS